MTFYYVYCHLMIDESTRRRARALALLLAAVAASASSWCVLTLLEQGREPFVSFDSLWSTALLTALAITCAWAGAVALVARTEIARPRMRVDGATRLVATALIAIAGWTVSFSGVPASASPKGPDAVATAPATALSTNGSPFPTPDFRTAPSAMSDDPAPDPGWLPTAPKAVDPADRSALVMPGAANDHSVVVHRGDTLWAIVGRALGPDASAAQIARAVPAWHEANRTVIGDNPDLLLAGQILHPPTDTDFTARQGSSR